jgi:hypothetical protein
VTPKAVRVLFGAICLGAAVWASWRWDRNYHWTLRRELPRPLPAGQVVGCTHRLPASATPTPLHHNEFVFTNRRDNWLSHSDTTRRGLRPAAATTSTSRVRAYGSTPSDPA